MHWDETNNNNSTGGKDSSSSKAEHQVRNGGKSMWTEDLEMTGLKAPERAHVHPYSHSQSALGADGEEGRGGGGNDGQMK